MRTWILFLHLASITRESVGLTCVRCNNAESHEDCDRNGFIETCMGQSDACKIERRIISNPRKVVITKGCKQRTACINQVTLKYCRRGPPDSKCYCCCDGSECNRGDISCFPNRAGSVGLFSDGTRRGPGRNRDSKLSDSCVPHVAPPTFGNMKCSASNAVGSRCVFTCSDFYELSEGPSTLICKRNGLWSSFPPTCNPVTCLARYTKLNDGYADCSNSNELNSVCSYRCEVGYTLEGSVSADCIIKSGDRNRAVWSSAKPRCVTESSCAPLEDAPNRIMSCNTGGSVGSACQFSCDSGFSLIGKNEIKCEPSYDQPLWNYEPPTCQKMCLDIPKVDKGLIECIGDRFVGAICSFNCKEGYNIIGDYQATCIEKDGEFVWDNKIPTCEETCPEIRNIPNGAVVCASSNLLNSDCLFTCDNDYELIGVRQLNCLKAKNGTIHWSDEMPVCTKWCPLVALANGFIECNSDNMLGSNCRFSCSKNYSLKGSLTISCEQDNSGNAVWSQALPICEKLCRSITLPSGSITCADDNWLDSTCTFDCDENYAFRGSETITCVEDVTGAAIWSSNLPVCEKRCSSLSLSSGSVDCNGNLVGSICTFTCDENHTLRGSQGATCTENREGVPVWSNKLPICEKRCPSRLLQNGSSKCDKEEVVGSKCVFACDPYYTLEGVVTVTCAEDIDGVAFWSEDFPVCKKVCPTLSSSSVSMNCNNNNAFGSICTFSCEENYSVSGSKTITCTEDNEGAAVWSNDLPVCQRNCPILTLSNGKITCDENNSIGSTCTFRCDERYTLRGNSNSTCEASDGDFAFWSKVFPICEKLCPSFEATNFQMTCSKRFVVGSTCRVKCAAYHLLQSPSLITCNEDANGVAVWSGPLVCNKLNCTDLFSVRNGNWNCTDNYAINSECTFSCVGDYEVPSLRPTTTTCQTDQTWTKLRAPCCSLPCPSNPYMDMAFALDSSSSVGQKSWDYMIRFIQTIIGVFDITDNGVRISVYRYNRKIDTDHVVPFNYGSSYGKQALLDKVESIPYDGSGTNTGKALQFAIDNIYVAENGHREDAREVLIVVTDGKSQDQVGRQAQNIRDHGILTFAIAVQPKSGLLDQNQLNMIAGVRDHLFILDDGFSSLTTDFAIQLARAVCHDPCTDEFQ